MSIIRSAKRRLGVLRDDILYGRENRRLAAQATAMRSGWIDAVARELPPLPEPPKAHDVEMHSMAGENQVAMGLWSTWSAMRFLPRGRFVLHDDGTLSEASLAQWRRLLPGMRVVSLAEGKAAVADRFSHAPKLVAWTQGYHFGLKLGSFQVIGETPRILEVDSDVLFFSQPDVLLEALKDPDWTYAWNQQTSYPYAYPEALLSEILGDLIRPLPPRLNGGLIASTRMSEDEIHRLDDILRALEADARVDHLRYWMHQTLLACVASRRGSQARPLPGEYDVYVGSRRPESVTRHYVGHPRIRPRFFTEGVPALIRSARASGHVPAGFAAEVVPETAGS